jgi:glucosamine--fructose-6-phosphate aminotransferase (isomerizing)
MCGIFGIVFDEDRSLGELLTDAGRRLSYRGYDSVGCATIDGRGRIDLRKDAGKVDDVAHRLRFSEMKGRRGIVQLRWATFGSPSQVNAQPHLDTTGRMVGAHNGNVVNNEELRREFAAEGMAVRSDNDGESCVHAVERYIARGYDTVEAVRHAYGDLEGDYAFVIGRAEENRLVAIKKGSGLVAGIADGAVCLSSDLPSILPLTRRIVRVHDGEIVILEPRRVEIRRVEDGRVVERAPEEITESMDAAQKGGYPHFMLKEIHEQPDAASELIHFLEASEQVAPIVERMASARNLYFVGCGTSYHACLLGAVYFARLARRPAIPVLAPQFIAQYGPALGPADLALFVSQSGETKDVLNALAVARRHGTAILGLVNVIGSTLMRESSLHLPLACEYEISVPATKTFINQCVAFLFLALRAGEHPTDDLALLPHLLRDTIDAVEPQVSKLQPALAGHQEFYCLGYGLTYPIALEGALKIKEITYAHCEGMLSTEFKHGPLSSVRDGYPVLFVSCPENVPLLVSGINETTCRGGRAIAIAEEDPRLQINAHELIVLPRAGALFNPVLAVLPLQLLAYKHSVALGHDPDFPRNLSKTLTVD